MTVVLLSVLYISHSSFRCDGDTLLLQTYRVNRFIENIFSLSREMLLRIPLHLLKNQVKVQVQPDKYRDFFRILSKSTAKSQGIAGLFPDFCKRKSSV